MQLRIKGKSDAGNIIQDVFSSPKSATKYKKAYIKSCNSVRP